MNSSFKLVGLFVFFFALQVLLLNKILLFDYINPYLYVVFVFIYPLKENKFPILSYSFLLGLLIDFFSDTGGIHALSLLFIAYIRSYFIKLYFKKDSSDFQDFNLKDETFGNKFNYVTTLTIIHHFIYFSFANFSFHNFDKVLLNTLYSAIFTLILFFLGNSIFSREA